MLAIAVLLGVLIALGAMIWLIANADRPKPAASDSAPDLPHSFGPGMAWIAVKSDSSG